MPVVAGDAYIATLATYVQTNSTRLAAAGQSSRGGLRKQASNSYLTTALTLGLAGPSAPPKPLTLRITPQNLFYLLLRFQAIALGDVGDLDVQLGKDTQRAMVFAETASPKRTVKDRTETASFMSAMSSVSTLNLGGWWGTTKVQDPDADLKLLYSAFTKLPSLIIHATGLTDETIEEMAGSGPLDTAVPLKVFKNLQSLEIVSLPPQTLVIPPSPNLRSLIIRDVESASYDEEAEWLVPILFGERAAVADGQQQQRRLGGSSLGPPALRMRQASGSSSLMDETLHEDEEEEGLGERPLLNGETTPPRLPPALIAKFPSLSHLGLPNLSLLTLPNLPLPSLVSLDLSQNLLLELPPSLASLPNVISLNLQGNMIASLRNAPLLSATSSPSMTTPRPAGLRALNLDDNRISNLHGLSSLLTLQRLSLRNNSLSESLELSRLTVLPLLSDLYVLPNPFAKNVPAEDDWRVRLWEGFAREGRPEAKTPLVDGEGVSWSERRRMKVPFHAQGLASKVRTAAIATPVATPRSPPTVPVGGPQRRNGAAAHPTSSSAAARRTPSQKHDDLFSPPTTSSPSPALVANVARVPPSSYHPPAAAAVDSSSSSSGHPAVARAGRPRRRRPKRIVNLDGTTHEDDSGTATGTDLSGDESGPHHSHARARAARRARSPSDHLRVNHARQFSAPNEASPSSSTPASHAPSPPSSPPPAVPVTASLAPPPPSTPMKADLSSTIHPSHSSLKTPRSQSRRSRISASVYEPSSSSTSPPPSLTSAAAAGSAGLSPAASADEYRRKLEAMRSEVGDSWLRVLSASSAPPPPPPSTSPHISAAHVEPSPAAAATSTEVAPEAERGEDLAVTRVVKKKKKRAVK